MVKLRMWWAGLAVTLLWCLAGTASPAVADTQASTSYRFEESTLGGGGLTQSNSANYRISDALADAGIGTSASANFQSSAGSKTPADPALSFAILGGAASFGNLSPAAAATATASFAVQNYTSYGYVVQIVGSAPNNGSKTLPAMATTAASSAGSEQFGINLAANTTPASFGANPAQGLFGLGVAAPNYATANQYRFVSGETIASAPKSSGITTYTISYIANVSSLTPGGTYSSNQTLICTGTY